MSPFMLIVYSCVYKQHAQTHVCANTLTACSSYNVVIFSFLGSWRGFYELINCLVV